MIVTSHPKGWQIIYQRAHGQLAAEIGYHWSIHPLKAAPKLPFVISLAEHDDGIQESRHPDCLTEAGAPKDFKLLSFIQDQYRNVIELSLAKSRWNGLLTSRHMSFLYEPLPDKSSDLKVFLKDQKALQSRLIKELDLNKEQVEYDYAIFQWCDALSLVLCQDLVPPEERKLEISKGPEGRAYFIYKEAEDYIIDPFPFDQAIELEVEYRIVEQLGFASSEKMEKALKDAPPLVRKFPIRPAKGAVK